MKGVFLDRDSLMIPEEGLGGSDVDLSPLSAIFPDWTFYDQTEPEHTLERIQAADVVITNKVVLDQSCLQQSASLGLVCVAATGTNNIDLDAAQALGIHVANVAGYATASVTEHVFALMLALSRRLPDYQRVVADGQWQRSEKFCLLNFPIAELAGCKLGIIGYGELGQSVARVAEAFGMQVLIATRSGTTSLLPGRLPLAKLLAEVDVLSLHCPLTEATQNLIGAEELALMKPNALLINTARGGIVDEQALLDALSRGQIGGAAIDVLSTEPPVNGSPLLDTDIPNLIVTPHIAWASRQARQRLVEGVADNIQQWVKSRD